MAEPVPVIDGHNDTLLRCTDDDRRAARSDGDDVPGVDRAFLERDGGHLDLPRTREAGLAAGLFAAFVPTERDPDADLEGVDMRDGDLPPALDRGVAEGAVLEQFAALHRWVRATDEFRLVGGLDDLDACLAGDALGAVPHLEGAAPIAADLSNLDLWYAAGLRSVGLVWSRPNRFAHGVPFVRNSDPDIGPGLTDAGRELVAACNDRGIVVDCAHLNAAGLDDVLDVSTAPPVVSHACAYGICPSSRNLTDEQLAAIGDHGGVVGLAFSTGSLRPDGDHTATGDVDLDLLVDHVDRFVEHAGIDAVAIGSDFDGATVPDCVGDVRGVRRLLDRLRERGYDDGDVERIAWRNWRRVLAETW